MCSPIRTGLALDDVKSYYHAINRLFPSYKNLTLKTRPSAKPFFENEFYLLDNIKKITFRKGLENVTRASSMTRKNLTKRKALVFIVSYGYVMAFIYL